MISYVFSKYETFTTSAIETVFKSISNHYADSLNNLVYDFEDAESIEYNNRRLQTKEILLPGDINDEVEDNTNK